jgi:hypothetical protein
MKWYNSLKILLFDTRVGYRKKAYLRDIEYGSITQGHVIPAKFRSENVELLGMASERGRGRTFL